MSKLPQGIVPPARRGPKTPRPSAGAHAQGVRRQRTRGAQRRAAIAQASA